MKQQTHSQQANTFKKRINTWIKKADRDDQSLAPEIRRRKWVLILCALFILFAASFLWNPMIHMSDDAMEISGQQEKSLSKNSTYGFEMPVDSFENHLKQNIHEKLSEKE